VDMARHRLAQVRYESLGDFGPWGVGGEGTVDCCVCAEIAVYASGVECVHEE